MKAWSKYNPIKCGDVRSLVPLVSVHEVMSEGCGHMDRATLTFFNLIRPMMALFVLVSRNTTHPPVHSEGYSLKHTAEQSVQHRTTQQRLHNVNIAWPICWLIFIIQLIHNYRQLPHNNPCWARIFTSFWLSYLPELLLKPSNKQK